MRAAASSDLRRCRAARAATFSASTGPRVRPAARTSERKKKYIKSERVRVRVRVRGPRARPPVKESDNDMQQRKQSVSEAA